MSFLTLTQGRGGQQCRSRRSPLHPLILLCLMALPVTPVQALSLDEARQQLAEHSHALAAQRADREAWQQQRQATRRLREPRVDLTVAGVAYGKQLEFDLALLNRTLEADIERTGVRSSVQLQWPLYMGGRIDATQRQAGAREAQSEGELRHAEAQLTRQMLDRYFAIQAATRVVEVREAALETLEAHAHRARRFEEQGLVNRLARLQAEVARDEARRDLVQSVRILADLRAALASMLATDALGCLTTPLPEPRQPDWPVETFVTQALAAHPQLAVLDARAEQAAQQVRIEQSEWLPELFAFGSYELNREATPLTEPDWVAGLGVKWALTSGLDRGSAVDAAQARRVQVRELTAQARQDLTLASESAYRGVLQHQEQYALLGQDLALAEENARLQDASFRAGLSTSLDVTEAHLGVARSGVQRAQAAYDYAGAMLDLLTTAGLLGEIDDFLAFSSPVSCEGAAP
ncbi:TolC family protein [Halomonas salifodinae]|uniref:TolC family protein n=1 Tax=Halomonas salifodinae TaxID=438745 RepID=UPI0033B97DBF